MTACLCRSLTTAIFVIATATLCAAAEPRSSTLRVVSGEKEAGPRFELTGKEVEPPAAALPQVTLPDSTPVLDAPPVPQQFGNELLEAAPNPYQATVPAESYAPEPPGDYFAPNPYGRAHHPRPAHRVVEHFQNRPRQPPLQQESWLNRPLGISFSVGGWFMPDPIPTLQGDPGTQLITRLSWDFGPHWGTELRMGVSDAGVTDIANPTIVLPKVDIWSWDWSWLYYPTGDTRWRPYFTFGLGMVDYNYYDAAQIRYHDAPLAVPFGVGFKYRYSTRINMRFDLIDNFTFATGPQDSMHNLGISAGLEGRFGGGSRKNYWPWNPGRDWR